MKKIFSIALLMVCSLTMAAQTVQYRDTVIRGSHYYIYPIEKSIGLYRISKNFGVSQEEILKANPGLEERGLRFGETILIPNKGQKITYTAPATNAATEATQPVATDKPILKEKNKADASVETVESFISQHTDTTPIILSVMLPLHSHATQRDANMNRFYDFYAGVLLAIEHHKEQKFIIRTFDTEKTAVAVQKMIADGKLTGSHGIIGPAYPAQVDVITAYAKTHHVPVIIPFTSQIDQLNTNPYVLQFNPTTELEVSSMVRYLAAKGDSINCVLVESEEKLPTRIKLLADSIRARQIPYTTTDNSTILHDSIGMVMADGKTNIILCSSDKASAVQMLIPHIRKGAGDKSFQLIGLYSWPGEGMGVPTLYTNIFSADSYAYDRASYETKFEKYFGHKLTSTSPRYDYLGYDLTNYFVSVLQQTRGAVEQEHITAIYSAPFYGLQSVIKMKRQAEGGYINEHITIEKR